MPRSPNEGADVQPSARHAAATADLRLDKVWLRFLDPDLERDFLEDQLPEQRRFYRALGWCTLPTFLVVWAAHELNLNPSFLPMEWLLETRIFAVTGCIASLMLSAVPSAAWFPRYGALAVCACFAMVFGTQGLGIARIPPDASVSYFIGLVIGSTFGLGGARLPVRYAVGVGAFIMAVFVVAGASSAHLKAGDVVVRGIFLLIAQAYGLFAGYQVERLRREGFRDRRIAGQAQQRSDELLLNVLPPAIADRLKAGESPIADSEADVTVLFADISGFTNYSAKVSPEELVERLGEIFNAFDLLADQHGLEKIKTIGDAYMVASGLPEPVDDHAERALRFAFDMGASLEAINSRLGERFQIRIGVHTGPVVAGVIGRRKFSYDLWGDTVNTASRMESHGMPGRIHISDETAQAVAGVAGFRLTPRGEIEVKGKGPMQTWFAEPATTHRGADA